MKALKILNQYNSFKALNKQLEQYTKNQQTKLAGDIFELAVKLYLQTVPGFLSANKASRSFAIFVGVTLIR